MYRSSNVEFIPAGRRRTRVIHSAGAGHTVYGYRSDVSVSCNWGKNSVIGDSAVWNRLNGKVHRTTLGGVLDACMFTFVPDEEGGRIRRPAAQLEMLTTNLRRQRQVDTTLGLPCSLFYVRRHVVARVMSSLSRGAFSGSFGGELSAIITY
jgi:hypothetical protein